MWRGVFPAVTTNFTENGELDLDEARAIYPWFRPLLELDVSTFLVQNIKLAEV
ncbi:4-hydroxy-tetrahydrodipicolinate synthase [Rhizobium mongolense subsp. loessense]|uniref:4-hydroxy-tetrahydrodipicolinate synthase n=1 Tax=Rhizobium mongolense subsp. loessense TaxID=158890 RepID=A0A1G4T593_9HYPH|nr:4-hydroxy-tetrahydrodipicolinate synthase [Rhizobium mongolense subsp. loessense]